MTETSWKRWAAPGIAAQTAILILLVSENALFAVFEPIGPPPLSRTLPAALPGLLWALGFSFVGGTAHLLASLEPRRPQMIAGYLALVTLLLPVAHGVGLMVGVPSLAPALLLAFLLGTFVFKLVMDFGNPRTLAALVPAAVVALTAVAITDSVYALRESVRLPMDPNALLFAGMGGLGFASSLAIASCSLDQRRSVAAAMITFGIGLTAMTLYANRLVIAPRLYLEAHIGIAFMEFLILSATFTVVFRRLSATVFKRVALVAATSTLVAGSTLSMGSTWAAARTGYHPELLFSSVAPLVDRDDDGFEAKWAGGRDCDDGQSDVNPIAPEVSDDGIDQNCDGTDHAAQEVVKTTSYGDADLVVVISIDTLRPSNMSFYGGPNPTTQHLDAIKNETVRFNQAYASGGITTLSLPSLLRGRIPLAIDFEKVFRTTDVRYVFPDEVSPNDIVNRAFPSPRSDQHPTIGSVFSAASRPSLAFVDDGPAGIFQKGFGFETGFSSFSYPNPPEQTAPWDRKTLTDAFLNQLGDIKPGGFVWLHYYDPHNAVPPCEQFEQLPRIGCYDDAIARVDAQIGRIIQRLKSTGRWENSMLVVTSDHGEGLGEHGLYHHGLDSYQEFVHIPLIVKFPHLRHTGEVDAPVSLIDVAPTALSAGGLDVPSTMQGVNLAEFLPEATANRPVLSQNLITRVSGVPYRQNSLLIAPDQHLMFDRVSGRSWAFAPPTDAFRPATTNEIDQVIDAVTSLEARPDANRRSFP